jgi:MFS family permease
MNVEPVQNGYLMSKKYSFFIFGMLFLLYMFDYIDRMVVVSLFPYLKSDWGLSDTQCGLLVSTVYWSIVVFSFPIAVIVDRWSRKKTIGLMALVWSMATLACAFTTRFAHLFIARTVIGVGEAGYAPGGTAMISAIFPEKMRSMMVGLFTAALPLGSAIGIVLGGVIAAKFGWRHAFGIVALPGFIIAILFFFIRDYKTVELEKTVDATVELEKKVGVTGELEKTVGAAGGMKVVMSRLDLVRQFTRTPSLILTYIAFAGCMFVTAAYLSWLPSYFNRVYDIPMETAALKSSGVMILAIVGFPLGGFLTDRWRRTRMDARILFPAVTSFLTAVVFFSAFFFFTGSTQYYLMLLGGMLAAAFSPAAIAVTQDVVHPGLRATSYSFCVIFQNLLGSSLGPLFVGMVSDRWDLTAALTIVPVASLIAAVLFFIGSRFYLRDLARVEKVELSVEDS